LFNKEYAYGFKIEVICSECGNIIDYKTYWSFKFPETKIYLLTLGYELYSEKSFKLEFRRKRIEK
jgi:hypothetical protein